MLLVIVPALPRTTRPGVLRCAYLDSDSNAINGSFYAATGDAETTIGYSVQAIPA